jgi:hypothetical protein
MNAARLLATGPMNRNVLFVFVRSVTLRTVTPCTNTDQQCRRYCPQQ